MVPLPRLTTGGGVPLHSLARPQQIERLVARTREAGTEIVKLFGKGIAFFSPAGSAIVMAGSFLKDKRRVLPGAALCEGEYGIRGLFLGVPCPIRGQGVEKIYAITLTDDEKSAPQKTAASVKKRVEETKLQPGAALDGTRTANGREWTRRGGTASRDLRRRRVCPLPGPTSGPGRRRCSRPAG
jgi:malate dehydrogenase